ncbi:MAG: ABC transporter ATP-binding protein [Candidatus Aenigmatarchaeota archaeon]
MPVIRAEKVGKNFGDIEALKDASLEVEEGEIVGILGPNGAGKSTLVNILTGQLVRDSGEAKVLGIDPSENPVELRKKLGILPEREDPPSFLTGNEYLDFVSDVRQQEFDISSLVDRLNLEGKMESLTKDLSKGERQKLMILQAFIHEPEIVFIDEPLVNLDPLIQEEAKKIFREHRDSGKTVFLCTHVISLAEEICDRVFFLKDGNVIDEITEVENLKQKFLDEE